MIQVKFRRRVSRSPSVDKFQTRLLYNRQLFAAVVSIQYDSAPIESRSILEGDQEDHANRQGYWLENQGFRIMPSRAVTVPGRTSTAAAEILSITASVWLGSWWNSTSVFTWAASARRTPFCQVE